MIQNMDKNLDIQNNSSLFLILIVIVPLIVLTNLRKKEIPFVDYLFNEFNSRLYEDKNSEENLELRPGAITLDTDDIGSVVI